MASAWKRGGGLTLLSQLLEDGYLVRAMDMPGPPTGRSTEGVTGKAAQARALARVLTSGLALLGSRPLHK